MFGVAGWRLVCSSTVFADYLPFIRCRTSGLDGRRQLRLRAGRRLLVRQRPQRAGRVRPLHLRRRISLLISVASIVIGSSVGTARRHDHRLPPRVDRPRALVFVDALLAIPALVFAALVVGRAQALRRERDRGPRLRLRLAQQHVGDHVRVRILSIAPLSRIVRAQTLSVSQREYVLAARSLGAKHRRILFREILPNVVPALVSVLFTGVAILLVAEAGWPSSATASSRPRPRGA